ncbi:hypothetical protein FNV43_RR26950 [Rhamnella rubrinervis]|uniref:FAS1 domain-containing protein n=1 Tax=Rhamnella rubrinervis TaxID=2594499 RepID=A0A8K0DP03_9ROSA|nr:hypothetical protein FNV43_RR26950 [Rhamnella rubrinervis]
MASRILIFFVLLSLISISFAKSTSIIDAAEILSDSGFEAMALTLELASKGLIPFSPSLTIFAPTDSAFAQSGQPPLALLQYHLLPQAFTYKSLKSLPAGARVPTLLANHTLVITTAPYDSRVSLNNVTVNGSPIYDDGSLIIFGIEKFFNPYFRFPEPIRSSSVKDRGCVQRNSNYTTELLSTAYPFHGACAVLRSKGCAVMASLLEMQFVRIKDQTTLTIFAPIDQVMVSRNPSLSEITSIFRRHIIPCKLRWRDLVDLQDGMELQSNLKGFTVNITRSHDGVKINGVPVILPDMYHNDWLVVHGVGEILEDLKHKEQMPETLFGFGNENEENTVSHYHFSVFRS